MAYSKVHVEIRYLSTTQHWHESNLTDSLIMTLGYSTISTETDLQGSQTIACHLEFLSVLWVPERLHWWGAIRWATCWLVFYSCGCDWSVICLCGSAYTHVCLMYTGRCFAIPGSLRQDLLGQTNLAVVFHSCACIHRSCFCMREFDE